MSTIWCSARGNSLRDRLGTTTDKLDTATDKLGTGAKSLCIGDLSSVTIVVMTCMHNNLNWVSALGV